MPIISDIIIQDGRSDRVSGPDWFYAANSGDINFRVKGIQENNTLSPVLEVGSKYIVKNISALHPNFGTITGVANNDIVWYVINPGEDVGFFQIFIDVSINLTHSGIEDFSGSYISSII